MHFVLEDKLSFFLMISMPRVSHSEKVRDLTIVRINSYSMKIHNPDALANTDLLSFLKLIQRTAQIDHLQT
ncbi:MAG: hypothetical protein RJA81_1730 [Planctomycetota bacterium]